MKKRRTMYYRTSDILPFPGWVLAVVVLIGTVALGSIHWSSEGPVVGLAKPAGSGTAQQASGSAPAGVTDSSEEPLRAWITSLMLRPPYPNREQTVEAVLDWAPQGRPGIGVSYEWLVNDRAVKTGEASELVLGKYGPGDRVSVIAAIIGPDGKRLASERSRSIIIQNRPPTLDGGIEEFAKTDNEWIGHLRFSDPDGDKVSVKLVRGPAGLTVQPDGTVRWPLAQIRPGKHELAVELEDERGLGFRGTLSFSIEAEG